MKLIKHDRIIIGQSQSQTCFSLAKASPDPPRWELNYSVHQSESSSHQEEKIPVPQHQEYLNKYYKHKYTKGQYFCKQSFRLQNIMYLYKH